MNETAGLGRQTYLALSVRHQRCLLRANYSCVWPG